MDGREKKLKLIEIILSNSKYEVEKLGYTEDHICAMDFEKDGVRLFMTDGETILIKDVLLIGPESKAQN
tara:strand:- start:20 stop:226 length:207 start_codon:yes stop_codon:yes gene_type:complete